MPRRRPCLRCASSGGLKVLNLDSLASIAIILFAQQGQKEEIVHLIDVVTTNKTDFFREPGHFDFLVEKALPELIARNDSGRQPV